MRYDPATRVLSLSFARSPEEHADVMFEAGRRMMTSRNQLSVWSAFGIAVGFGATVGIVMEIHRRFVLPLLFGPSEIAPLGRVVVQLLPLILLFVALYAALHLRAQTRRRKAMITRLQPDRFVDIDIFPKGISMSGGHTSVEVDWSGVTDILADGGRVEFECESFVLYIPARAFENHAAYAAAVKDIRHLWRDAIRLDHDRKMVAAGLE